MAAYPRHSPAGGIRWTRSRCSRPTTTRSRSCSSELESTTERGVKTRGELFATIKGELTLHEIVEEEIFYPELKAHPKAKDIVLEGYEEHHVVDVLMGELEALDVTRRAWGAKALVMKENIEHHIEEEEGEMFAKARQVFDGGARGPRQPDGGAQADRRPRVGIPGPVPAPSQPAVRI